MTLADTYPVIEGYLGSIAVGGHIIFEDPMQFDQLTATLAFAPLGSLPSNQRLHADIDFHTIAWNFEYWHNLASFYDLTGPTELARKGDAILVTYKKSYIYDPPQQLDFTAQVAGYTGLDTLPGAQNVHTSDDGSIGSVRLALNYTNTARSLGAVDHESGIVANVAVEPDYSNGGLYPRVRAGLGFGFPLGWAHSSLWLYNAAGVSGGDPTNALGPTTWALWQQLHRQRRSPSLPRLRQLPRLPDRRHRPAGVRPQPARVDPAAGALRRGGKASLFLSFVRAELFAGALADVPASGPERNLATVGAQVDFNFTIALRLPMTFSLGYAHGFELDNGAGVDAQAQHRWA